MAAKAKKQSKSGKVRGFFKVFGKVLGSLFLIIMLTGLICGAAFFYYIVNYLNPTMDINLSSYKLNQTTYIVYLDEEGRMVEQARLSSGGESSWVSIKEMPQYLLDAVVAIEDERFWKHNGVDWKRTARAVLNLFTGNDDRFGASTITQQLIKNLTGEDEYSMTRKIEEILRALNLQKNNSKEEILEYYLNTIALANNCKGVEAAARKYFGKTVSELTLAECASIVGITKYPVLYNPLTRPANNKERQETVLWKMWDLGMITEEEYRAAKAEQLVFQNNEEAESQLQAQSWFVDETYREVLSDLINKKGYEPSFAKALLLGGGLTIVTAMDKQIQDIVDEVFTNEDNFAEVSTEALPEASIAIMDPFTGAVVAMYGGRGEKTGDLLLNRATSTYRQPGSTIKPIAVYAPALEYGVITEGSVYDDTPYIIETAWPKNYDSGTRGYRGRMTVIDAVANSVNTVAVKVLADLGLERSYDFMTNNLHFSKLTRYQLAGGKVMSDVNLSPLALGGLTNGVSVLELTAAYSSFANHGIYTKPYTYYKVIDANGIVILENIPEQSIAMSEQTAFLINDLLQNVVQNGTGTPAKLGSMPVAAKTGTTSDDKDRWFVGYTPYYCSTVWFGYDIPEVIKVSGTNPALRLWKAAMEKIHENLEPKDFFMASNIIQAQFCADSGLKTTETCLLDPRGNRVRTAYFVAGTEPTKYCDTHIEVQIDTLTGTVATPNCPKQYLKTVGMLNVKREFPYEIWVVDSQYTYLPLPVDYIWPKNGVVYQNLLAEGMNPGTSWAYTPMNYVCYDHPADAPPEDEYGEKEDDEGGTETPPVDDGGSKPPFEWFPNR